MTTRVRFGFRAHSNSGSQSLLKCCDVQCNFAFLCFFICASHQDGTSNCSEKREIFKQSSFFVLKFLKFTSGQIKFPFAFPFATLDRKCGWGTFLFIPLMFRHSMACRAAHRTMTSEFHRQFTNDITFLFSFAAAHGHHFRCPRYDSLCHTKITLNCTFHLVK